MRGADVPAKEKPPRAAARPPDAHTGGDKQAGVVERRRTEPWLSQDSIVPETQALQEEDAEMAEHQSVTTGQPEQNSTGQQQVAEDEGSGDRAEASSSEATHCNARKSDDQGINRYRAHARRRVDFAPRVSLFRLYFVDGDAPESNNELPLTFKKNFGTEPQVVNSILLTVTMLNTDRVPDDALPMDKITILIQHCTRPELYFDLEARLVTD
ncbi:uncharacterized protein KRP23_4850 [Phytophthora ramorum]|uniref:uncharacterized protein n=1 Tax=Phytophthora ramorum TaxID=164328 RepID=UPI0030992A12|nr:hypothetical protein KRP23_4850 [Phytophthora ramorum]